MQPIESLSREEAGSLRGLLFDLDDTLLDHGRLGEAAYGALFRLRESNMALVAVTGRPSGWGDVLARQWPIDGIVTENGAVALLVHEGRLTIWDTVIAEERAARLRVLSALAEELEAEFPELRRTDDARARLSDITYDIGEYRRVDANVVERAAGWVAARGARSVRSSVHFHLTLEAHDKASGTVEFLRRRFREDSTACLGRFAFIGDSENDAACFAAFRTTIGVQNLRGRPTVGPRFATTKPRGAGFAEAANVIVARRR